MKKTKHFRISDPIVKSYYLNCPKFKQNNNRNFVPIINLINAVPTGGDGFQNNGDGTMMMMMTMMMNIVMNMKTNQL